MATRDRRVSAESAKPFDVDAPGGAYRIRSVERVTDILDLLSGADGSVSLGEVAKSTGTPRSTAFRYLANLESRAYVERESASGHYSLGPRFPRPHSDDIERLVRSAQPHVADLARARNETVNLGALVGTGMRYLLVIESARQVRLAAKVGDRESLHCTALGKAVAAEMPPRDVRRLLELDGMSKRTQRTITDVDLLLEELSRVRAQGYALDDRENEDDGRCVAVPLPDTTPKVALSLSAPSQRFPLDAVASIAKDLDVTAKRVVRDFAQRSDEDDGR